MFISDTAIKRPILTIVAMLGLVVFGIAALTQIDTDEYPEINAPVVVISIPYPGASPDTVEREVIEPNEKVIAVISGVDRMTSNSLDSFANIIVEFVFEKNPAEAMQEIRDQISGIRNDRPVEMKEPVLTRFDPADQPIVSLTLSSPGLGGPQLTRMADPDMTRKLRGIAGVAQVTVVGGVQRELVVELRPHDLQASGVSVAQVVQAMQSQNLAAPVGRLEGDLQERTIRLKGRLQGPTDFAQLVVTESNGRIVRLGDIANVRDATEEARSTAMYNDEEAVGIDIIKSRGYSTTSVADEVRLKVADIQKTLPAGVNLRVVRDGGTRVENSVANVEESLLLGALLTVFVVFLFLNSWRSTVITGLALPVSVLASFVAVWSFGFTLNTMSLLGLSLAIGILIDDAIVVRENIVRHIEMGKDHLRASHEATDEIGLAVAATTFSIVAVFVPVAFMYGIAGQWFKPFALTIACAVLVSLFVSFSLDPMLSAYWADPQTESHERRNPIARALDRFNRWFDRQAERYQGLIAWALDHRLAMVLIALGSFFGAIALQATLGGAGFIPISDRSEINFIIEAPPGSSLEYTRLKSEEVERIARRHPEVAYTYTGIGTPIPLMAPGVDQALTYVRLVPKKQRSISQDRLGEMLREELSHVGGAEVSVFTSGFGGAMKQIQVEMRGDDPTVLTRFATRAAGLVRKVPGAVDVGLSTRGERPELVVELRRGLAGSLGVTVAQVAQSLRPAFAGIDAVDWVYPTGETRDVTVRLAPEARERTVDLERLPLVIPGPTGAPVTLPLGQVASIHQGLGPAQINHLNREAVVNVQANVQGRSLTEVTRDINARLASLERELPPGYRITQGGEARDQAEVFTRIFTALGAAVVLMYLILVVQFGSFLDPLAILISLPLSLIGVVLALIITRDTLNIMSLIGVILLMGIVAKNAILLIDFAKWAHERGTPLREALIEAGRIRLRPIMMTTIALIAGMVPVALGRGEGADFRAPLGRAVIGGVITSTLLTLLVIPTVYEILAGWREAFFKRVLHHKAPHTPGGGLHAPTPEPAGD